MDQAREAIELQTYLGQLHHGNHLFYSSRDEEKTKKIYSNEENSLRGVQRGVTTPGSEKGDDSDPPPPTHLRALKTFWSPCRRLPRESLKQK
ncbi:hypothetical protein E2C01_002542 [Portunus trituberculatus]|uniref:Uncharacterized protein n=1 Tax=Portunus trituberculatus TaxID=210409 RepID=A0A5B7CJM0_PORTR|nr:hypothetical protein [Portunus trituberculatus]